jgi:hypothetical protein
MGKKKSLLVNDDELDATPPSRTRSANNTGRRPSVCNFFDLLPDREFVERGFEPPQITVKKKKATFSLFSKPDITIRRPSLVKHKTLDADSGVYLGPPEPVETIRRRSFNERRPSICTFLEKLKEQEGSASDDEEEDCYEDAWPVKKLVSKTPDFSERRKSLARQNKTLDLDDDGGIYLGPPEDSCLTSRRGSYNCPRSDRKPSICSLFENIPQREFVEEGYDPDRSNKLGPGSPSSSRRPSLTSSTLVTPKAPPKPVIQSEPSPTTRNEPVIVVQDQTSAAPNAVEVVESPPDDAVFEENNVKQRVSTGKLAFDRIYM